MSKDYDAKVEEMQQLYKKFIENEVAKQEEDKAQKEKYLTEKKSEIRNMPKKFTIQIHETIPNLIAVLMMLAEIEKAQKND